MDYGQAFLCLFVVLLFGYFGGFLLRVLYGMKIPKKGCFPGVTIKPLIKGVVIPPLLGYIIFGCIARNTFGDELMSHYPEKWGSYLRSMCLAVLIVRSGFEIELAGKIMPIITLSLLP